jgi:UDP-apiose/xylose synthase
MNTDKNRPSLCILGCGGFIGSHLLDRLLKDGTYSVAGIDIASSKIAHHLPDGRFAFECIDVHDSESVRPCIEQADAVISLVALCNPSLYNKVPIEVIDINFTRQIELVKMCTELGKWLIHFSTSEVYGRTAGSLAAAAGHGGAVPPELFEMNEDTTPMVLGPVAAQRWTYASAKQLTERLIYAYGAEKGLAYTIVRPFNFIGPRMDYLPGIDGEGVPRVLACFMEALIRGTPLYLVDGGKSRRVFTYIGDAVDAVVKMLEKPENARDRIFNIGHPGNETSIAGLASKMVGLYRELVPGARGRPVEIKTIASKEFYGEGYEDSDRRMPDISKARLLLGWEPQTDLETALRNTMAWYVGHYTEARDRRN